MRERTLLRKLVELAQYGALRGAFALLHSFSVDQGMDTAAGLGSVLYRCSGRHRRRACTQISRAFPGMSAIEVSRLAERSMQSMLQLFMIETVAAPRLIGPRTWTNRVEMGELGAALRIAIADRPALFLTGHCGNWELLGSALALLGFPMTALARPLDNPWLDGWIRSVREARGLRILTKFGATGEVQKVIEAGGRVAFIADQNAGDDGLFVPFFGTLASSYKSIGLLAMRHNLPIVVGATRRLDGQFRHSLCAVDVIEPADWEAQDDPLFYITARFNRGIETAIRRAPEQYLWIHRRWKSRPPWERKGEPMPERYRRRLEALPWMTHEELERCSQPMPALA